MNLVLYQTKAFVGKGASLAQGVSVFLIGTTLATSGYLGHREFVEKPSVNKKHVGFLGLLTMYALAVPTLMYFIGIKPLVIRIVKSDGAGKICLETTNFWGRRKMSAPLEFDKLELSASRFPGLINIQSGSSRYFLPSIQGFTSPEFRSSFLGRMEESKYGTTSKAATSPSGQVGKKRPTMGRAGDGSKKR